MNTTTTSNNNNNTKNNMINNKNNINTSSSFGHPTHYTQPYTFLGSKAHHNHHKQNNNNTTTTSNNNNNNNNNMINNTNNIHTPPLTRPTCIHNTTIYFLNTKRGRKMATTTKGKGGSAVERVVEGEVPPVWEVVRVWKM